MTRLISGLSDLAQRYDVILSDIWGVIHNGREHFPEPCAALARWRIERGPVVLISNAPRPASDVIPQLDGLGVPRGTFSAIVTSGDTTRHILQTYGEGPAWRIGPDRDGPLYEGLPLRFAPLDQARLIALTGPDDDEVEGPEDYRERLTLAAARKLPMVCANPDIVVQRGDRLVYCGGALAALYESLGGPVRMAGKPHAPIYAAAIAEAERLLGHTVDRRRILCVGDGVVTDIRGANDHGLDVLFIASGIHGDAAKGPDGALSPAGVAALLDAEGVTANYAMGDLAW
ncbi:TIGR01459 family HAD-type hydrolase [Caulobacter sp. KR2-114]|uniref:TIGR01459 family HAD-type hydrolase n=1 Tax=Caulobacter sp. KR2-114 TaxID=3400912 RepID=UPI003C081032